MYALTKRYENALKRENLGGKTLKNRRSIDTNFKISKGPCDKHDNVKRPTFKKRRNQKSNKNATQIKLKKTPQKIEIQKFRPSEKIPPK